MDRKIKSGGITIEEQRSIKQRAVQLLEKVKNSKKEQEKVPFRVDSRTIIMVSPKKYKKLMKKQTV